MKFDLERLYHLLPAIHRIRDAELGLQIQQETGAVAPDYNDDVYGPLRALIAIIADEVGILEENLDQLYDDLFIETCAEWVVPYIGELVGYRSLIEIPNTSFSQRAEVANTIKYRRQKGTLHVLEQLARDTTQLDSNIVEYFQLLATTQYMNHLRPQNIAIPRINNNPLAAEGNKDWQILELVNTPFDQMPKTADVRSIVSNRGKYNIPNIGIYLWRIKAYPLTKAPAHKIDDNRYTFNVLGIDTQLYNRPTSEQTATQIAKRMNVAMPISRRELHEDLEVFYGKDKSIFLELDGQEVLNDNNTSLEDLICVCNLSDDPDNSNQWINMPSQKIAIDPVLGRIALPQNSQPPPPDRTLYVTYYYGFSADIGGGEYERADSFELQAENHTVIEVPTNAPDIQNAINQLPAEGGIIEITDNEIYEENLVINIDTDEKIEIRASNGKRPLLKPSNSITINGAERSGLVLNGLMIDGKIETDDLTTLKINHCTLVPSANENILINTQTAVEINKSIIGIIKVTEASDVTITDSILDAIDTSVAVYTSPVGEGFGARLSIENSTVIGRVYTRLMNLASNTIFIAEEEATPTKDFLIEAQRIQEGCVRFSFFPEKSKLPRPFRCQPALSGFEKRVYPLFTSLKYGDAGYCQLSQYCAKEITEGADNGAEMGVFHQEYYTFKYANLRTRLNEYLRFGMEVGIFYAS